jgi:hypothetical protein
VTDAVYRRSLSDWSCGEGVPGNSPLIRPSAPACSSSTTSAGWRPAEGTSACSRATCPRVAHHPGKRRRRRCAPASPDTERASSELPWAAKTQRPLMDARMAYASRAQQQPQQLMGASLAAARTTRLAPSSRQRGGGFVEFGGSLGCGGG